MSSLRDRLGRRARPQVTYSLRVEDTTAAQAAVAAAQESGDDNLIQAAQTTLSGCYEILVITALPPQEVEELLGRHPPADPAKKNDWPFNEATFVPALLAACIDSDVTEEDWVEYTTKGPMSRGEVMALFDAVWSVNYRAQDPSVPLGSTQTPN
ncbi:MAG: hypothetical protein ACREQ3_24920 [Candidatus Binatia bacterium]